MTGVEDSSGAVARPTQAPLPSRQPPSPSSLPTRQEARLPGPLPPPAPRSGDEEREEEDQLRDLLSSLVSGSQAARGSPAALTEPQRGAQSGVRDSAASVPLSEPAAGPAFPPARREGCCRASAIDTDNGADSDSSGETDPAMPVLLLVPRPPARASPAATATPSPRSRPGSPDEDAALDSWPPPMGDLGSCWKRGALRDALLSQDVCSGSNEESPRTPRPEESASDGVGDGAGGTGAACPRLERRSSPDLAHGTISTPGFATPEACPDDSRPDSGCATPDPRVAASPAAEPRTPSPRTLGPRLGLTLDLRGGSARDLFQGPLADDGGPSPSDVGASDVDASSEPATPHPHFALSPDQAPLPCPAACALPESGAGSFCSSESGSP